MEKSLGRKKLQTNKSWRETYLSIESKISRESVLLKAAQTVALIKQVAGQYKKIGWFYSAGKDSLVVQRLLEMAFGETPHGAIVDFNHHFQSTIDYVNEHKPASVETLDICTFTNEEINKFGLFYGDFPKVEAMRSRRKWKAQRDFAVQNGMDCMITGRRVIDGNVCGNKGVKHIYTKAEYDTFNPIWDWSHEQVLGFLKYHDIPLPGCYFYPDGFLIGTVEWVYWHRRGLSTLGMLDLIHSVEPETVLNAASCLTEVARWRDARCY